MVTAQALGYYLCYLWLHSQCYFPHPSDLRAILPELPAPSPPTFFSLQDRLLSLLFSALQHETDPSNVQMLLHGMLVFIQDIVTYENAVTRMLEAEEVDGEEQERLHPPLSSTRSDASTQSQSRSLFSAVGKGEGSAGLLHGQSQHLSSPAEFEPPGLLTRAIAAAQQCLKAWEGNVLVSLAALELMTGLAQQRIENASECSLGYCCSSRNNVPPPPSSSKVTMTTGRLCCGCVST